jgi:hypothetical protein
VIFNKVAIEHNLIVPTSFSASFTQVQPINSNTTKKSYTMTKSVSSQEWRGGSTHANQLIEAKTKTT